MPPRFQHVSAEKLREIFNNSGYLERAQANDLIVIVKVERNPGAAANQPPGTKSQLVYYYEKELTQVAIVHQYVLPDGSIGASGLPDPKWVYWEGLIYAKAPEAPST